MSQQVLLGVIALAAGGLAAVLLFVPFVALSYRRRGRLGVGRVAAWAAALVYFWAIWAYTLLPLPDPASMTCAGVNLDPFAFVGDIRTALAAPGNPLLHPAMLQLALNVVLFLPLGFFLRVLGGRGVVTALLVGLGVSLLIETTQLTGVWRLYPCAYRVFDVDDLLTNTAGAVAGSVVALVVPRRWRTVGRADDAGVPRVVTRGRRLLAMLCDWLGVVLSELVLGVAVLLGARVVGASHADWWVTTGVPLIAAAGWLVVVLSTGRSIGDLAVELRYVGGPLPALPSRVLRWAGGVGGYILLGLLPGPWQTLSPLFAVVAVVSVFITRLGRGLPGLVSAQRLADARDVAAAADRSDRPAGH